jgi:putative hydrolase of the HAD superfamily
MAAQGGFPRAVLFDLDNTLTPRRACVAAFASIFARDWARELAAVDLSELTRVLVEVDRGGYNPRRGSELLERLTWLESPSAGALDEHWLGRFPDAVVARPGMLELLDGLARDGVKLGVVTNGGVHGQNRKIDRLGLRGRLASVIVSDAVGCKKPDARIFELACESLALPARDCWFVGDHPENDVLGAMRAGMTGVWIRDAETGHAWPEGEPPPHHEVETLLELRERLAGR